MTCVVGIERAGAVYIGADRLGSTEWTKTERRDTKVWKKGKMIFGATSSYRMLQLLRYKLVIPHCAPDRDPFEYMVASFVEAVRTCLKTGGYTLTENNRDQGGQFLVGFRGRLFHVESDFQVGESQDGFAACGCGEDFALGALAAMPRGAPDRMIAEAIDVAAHFSTRVGRFRGDLVELGAGEWSAQND